MATKTTYTSGAVLPDGTMLEQIIDSDGDICFMYCASDNVWKVSEREFGEKLYRPIESALVTTGTVMFPSATEQYGSIKILRQDVQDFIHHYVDISDFFEKLASYYVLLSWVYQKFNVLPYLRAIGEPGTGKSRFLQVMAALCYKAMRTSGAISIASIFRMIEQFHGTLILEEADLPSRSDEYAAAVKILNSGHERGNPVIRQEQTAKGYESVAYDTFCPKVIATRKRFADMALESRMITEKMTKMKRPETIRLNLPTEFNEEALHLRNRLLTFRFVNYSKIEPSDVFAMRGIEPRILHIISPMLDLMSEQEEKDALLKWAEEYTQSLITERGASLQGDVVRALFDVIDTDEEPTVKAIADRVNVQYERDADKLSNRRIGKIINDLGLTKRRYERGYAVDTAASKQTLELLKRQYGIG